MSTTCNTTFLLKEDFEEAIIRGAMYGYIYGTGSYDNKAYMMNGTRYGWFNLKDNLSDETVYFRRLKTVCQGEEATLTLFARESYGEGIGLSVRIVDSGGKMLVDGGEMVYSQYKKMEYKFTPMTRTIYIALRMYATGGPGVDLCVDDLYITQCCIPEDASKVVSPREPEENSLSRQLDKPAEKPVEQLVEKESVIKKVSKELKVKGNVVLKIYDKSKEDGDIVNIFVDDKLILSNYEARKRAKRINVEVGKGTYIKVQNVHEGAIPPNTVVIEVRDGERIQKLDVETHATQEYEIKLVPRY